MIRKFVSIFLCVTLSGCGLFGPVKNRDRLSAIHETMERAEPTSKNAAQLPPPGSRIQILDFSGNKERSVVGTVLHWSPEGVALLNCECSDRLRQSPRNSFSNPLFKISGTAVEHHPVYWVSSDKINGIEPISPPPPNYLAPQLDIDTNDKRTFRRVGT